MLQYASRALAQRLLICLLLLAVPKTGNTQIAPPMPKNAASSQTVALARSRPLYASLLPGSLQDFLGTPESSSPEYVLFSGLWRTDGGFHSTVRMKNVLVVAPLHVTPVLYMADGTEYSLPAVDIPISGVATVDINAALADVPRNIVPHISQHGSVALKYRYSSTGHLAAYVAIIDPLRSLSFTFPFVEPGAMQMVMASHSDQHVHSTPQTMEGLWWKHDGGVTGFVTLTNMTAAEQKAAVRISGSLGHAGPTQSVTLCAHCTQVLDLAKVVKDLPNNEQQAGGVSVQYTQMGNILVGGGLLNEGEGYSANIPFWPHATTSSPIAMTYASVGIMTGKADPMNGFPAETVFMPYLSLRNTSTKPLDVILRVNYMKGAAPATVSLPPQRLRPMEARQIEMSVAFAGLALADFNGVINLAVSLTGQPGDLVIASGSVDQTGTYVFEVEPQGTGTSQMKFANYWSVAEGNDTMYSLWNPTETAQDLKVTFYYGDGSGKYVLPLHLAGQTSAMIDMKEVIMQQKPDLAGNIIPFAILEGSVTIANAKGDHEQMTIVVSGGVYNAADATCGPPGCINCCGYSNFANTPGNGFACAVGETMDFTTTGTDCSGSTTVFGADWSSDNTSYATMNASTMSGLSPGAVNIGNYLGYVVVYTGQFCAGYDCPSSAPTITSPGNIVQISLSCPSVTRGSQVTCTASAGGPSFTTNSWKFTDPSNNVVNRTTSGSSWSGPVVQSGVVSVNVVVNTTSYSVQTNLTVNARNWATAPATAVEAANGSLDNQGIPVTLPVPPAPTGNDSGLGFYEARFNRNGFNNNVVTGDSPNTGYIFYNTALSYSLFDSRYEINPDLENSSSTFSVKNCGQNGYISWSNLLAQTRRHEYNSATESHAGEYVSGLSANDPGPYFESRVGPPGSDQNAFNNATAAEVDRRLNAIAASIAVEPYPVNASETNQFLGNINYQPYGACP